jgi:hypothetical protein
VGMTLCECYVPGAVQHAQHLLTRPTNAAWFMTAILVRSNHRHVSASHVVICRVVKEITNIYIYIHNMYGPLSG